jgi:hypothetical protein
VRIGDDAIAVDDESGPAGGPISLAGVTRAEEEAQVGISILQDDRFTVNDMNANDRRLHALDSTHDGTSSGGRYLFRRRTGRR